tara:strand:+ start:4078 stop:4251 length:174 start_codon:yes stop_codon:yes gene_type:complete
MKIKGINIDRLTPRQQIAMQRHSVHHSQEHIKIMLEAMLRGKSFTESHNIAMKLVGK